MLQRWAKHGSNVNFANSLIAILSQSLVVQDYYNDTLPDPSTMLQKQLWWLLS